MIYKPTFRCSELPRILACNGSATITAMVEPRSGSEGNEGTALHWSIAQRICRELGGFGQERLTPTCSIQVAKNVTWIEDFCFREVQNNTPADWALEVEVPLAYTFDRFILSGHIDALAINYEATEAIGWDYKTGYESVDPAEYNDQVLGYIVLLRRAYPSLRRVTFFIVQPRNDEDDGFQRVSKVVVDGEALEKCVAFLEKRIDVALDNPLLLNSGMVQCHWCSAAVQCPAIHAEINAMKMLLTPENLARIKNQADDATLADIVMTARTIENPIKDAKAMLHDRIDTKTSLIATDGTVITRTLEAGNYEIIDPVGFYLAARKLITDDAQYALTVKPSVSRTKDMLATALKIPKTGKEKKTAQKVFDAELRPFVKQHDKRMLQFAHP